VHQAQSDPPLRPEIAYRALHETLHQQDGQRVVAPYTAEMAMLSGGVEWSHRDPFDRMIAATAIEMASAGFEGCRL